MKKIVAILIGFFLTTQVAQARNNAALFGVAAAAVAATAIIANSQQQPKHHYQAPHRKPKHHKKHKKVVITDEMRIQKSLTNLGFYGGKIDGKLNSYTTRNAIKKMNKEYGISNGTTIDQKTWDQLLYLAELFQMDKDLFSEGNKKITKGKRVQTALKVYGTYSGEIDGIVGNGTRKSIAIYKKREGLTLNTSLSPNERYNLIDSAKRINSETIEEAIANLSPQPKRSQTRKAPKLHETPRATKVQEPIAVDSSGNDVDDMQNALDSIDNSTN